MQPYLIAIIIIAVVIFITAVLFALAAVCDKLAFGKRSDKNPLLKYYSAKDFNLNAERVELRKNGVTLRGFLYAGDKNDGRKLIIFCHGMGPGHEAYTTEIAYFCRIGYTVLAIDGKGCNLSGGKSLGGMYEGVKNAVAAIDFAKSDERLKNMPICLIGHSWGAYSAACAAAERKVEKVVAISGFDSPSQIMRVQAASQISRPLAAILRPFWYLINFFKFGARGNARASKSIKSSGVRALLIHGENDKVVPLNVSAFAAADGENVVKLLVRGRAHNPYITDDAAKLMAELTTVAIKVKKSEEDLKFLQAFDFAAVTEEDEKVMRSIADFLC